MRLSTSAPQHKGRQFIILGGAPSLHDDLKQCPDDAIRIGVNHRAVKFYPVDYVACFDVKAPEWIRAITDAPIISPLPAADIQIHVNFHPINSGILSIHYARLMGASRIYCCGMDFYRGEFDYVDGGKVKAENKAHSYGRRCRRLALSLAGDVELVRFSWW